MSLYNNISEIDFDALQYGNPFSSISDQAMPEGKEDIFGMVELLWHKLGTYRQAIQRVVRYFLTEVEFPEADYEEAQRWGELLNRKLSVHNILNNIGDDFLAYGNSITTVFPPFIRYLQCPDCSITIRATHLDYSYNDGKYSAKCPKCKKRRKFEEKLRKDPNPENINVIRWAPQSLTLIPEMFSGVTFFKWQPTDEIKKAVRNKRKFYLDRLPTEVIECVEKNKQLLLSQDLTYHLKIDTLAGITNCGWGLPPVLSNFNQIWYIQMLRHYNEAIALDYMVPLRIISPPPAQSNPAAGADPMFNMMGASQFLEKALEMVEDRRTNPTGWYTMPFPVQYGPIGGEGHEMLRPDLLKAGMADLLNGMGVPVELYQGNLQTQAAPVALRQFESTWQFLVSGLNDWLSFFTNVVALIQGWDQTDVRLKPSELVDDIMRKQLLLQLAFQGQISKRTALGAWDIDTREESERLQEEQAYEAKQMQELDKEIAKGQQSLGGPVMGPGGQPGGMVPGVAGGPPQGGQPAPMGIAGGQPPGGSSIEQMSTQAEGMAQQLMSMDSTMRKSELIRLKRDNPALHALVSQNLENIRQELSTQGQAQLKQQIFG